MTAILVRMGCEPMEIQNVLDFIEQADDYELNEMMDAITERYQVLHPDWEVSYLALPKHDRHKRREILEFALKYEQKADEG